MPQRYNLVKQATCRSELVRLCSAVFPVRRGIFAAILAFGTGVLESSAGQNDYRRMLGSAAREEDDGAEKKAFHFSSGATSTITGGGSGR